MEHRLSHSPTALVTSTPTAQIEHSYIKKSRRLRRMLAFFACLTLSLVVLWPIQSDVTTILKIIHHGDDASNKPNAIAINPIYTTEGRQGERYIIKAERAIIKNQRQGNITLFNLDANQIEESGNSMRIKAQHGFFDNIGKKLHLEKNIILSNGNTYTFQTEKATFDIKNSHAYGDHPVIGNGVMGKIQAQGFTISENGKRLLFSGKTKLVIFPRMLKASSH